MELLKKQNIAAALAEYCERYGSIARAANTLKDVSRPTVSGIMNGNMDFSDEIWRSIAAQIGYKEEKWEAVETGDFRRLNLVMHDAQENALVMGITGDAGSGKSFAAKYYQKNHANVYLLSCSEYWNKKLFLIELLNAMGIDAQGRNIGEMMHVAVMTAKRKAEPLIVLDEADKLPDSVLYFFITLYNQLEDECGLILIATNYLEKRLRAGLRAKKKGYAEIWSRLGRKCVALRGVSAADITAICEANGISDPKMVGEVIEDSESDLRRVKRKVHALSKKRTERE